MPYYLVDYRMKRLLPIFLFFFGCETFDVATDNPLDPSNPEYVKPTISILSPSDQQTINADKVDVTFQGNELVTEYRYKIVTSDAYKAVGWSDWFTSNKLSLEFLNEYTYTINAQSRYLNEETSDETSVTFTVDAVKPSSLLLYPKQIQGNVFANSKLLLYAHELTNVSALDFIIEYDETKMAFAGNQGSKVYGDVNVVRNSTNQIHYTIGKYGNNGFAQNALIAEIVFQMKDVSGLSSFIKILSPTAKSLDGQTIEIVGANQTRVDIK